MIKGRKLTFDERFGTEMSYFLGSINCSNVTYERSEIKIDGKMTDNIEIQFNHYKSINEYQKSLGKKYDNAKNELEITLVDTYSKYDKISLITDIISEVSSFLEFLKKNPDGSFTHKLFQFSNSSLKKSRFSHKLFQFSILSLKKKYQLNTINESFCQKYYYWMHYYLNKMYDFLKNQLENNRFTDQNEFPIPPSLTHNKNNSNKEKPLEYFEYLFKRNGLNQIKNDFIHYYDNNESADFKYDKESETITHYSYNQEGATTKWIETKKNFNDLYSSRLYKEYCNSCKFIDDYISEQKKESAITIYVKLNLIKLKNLLITIERDKEAKKYESSQKPINQLIQFFQENYFEFLHDKKVETRINYIEIDNKKTNPTDDTKPIPKKSITTFKWKSKSPTALSTILYQKLKEANFICNLTELAVFHKAFNGLEIEKPLKIKWIAKGKNQLVNKLLLLYLMNNLAENKLIEENTDNITFIKTLEFVFYDSDGNPLKNLKVSNATLYKKKKTKTDQQIIIDRIITELK